MVCPTGDAGSYVQLVPEAELEWMMIWALAAVIALGHLRSQHGTCPIGRASALDLAAVLHPIAALGSGRAITGSVVERQFIL
jgi:hypothetical protein